MSRIDSMDEQDNESDLVDPESDFEDILGDIDTEETDDEDVDDTLDSIGDGKITLDEL